MSRKKCVKVYVRKKSKVQAVIADYPTNQTMLAEKVGITKQYLSNVLNGSSISSVTADKIAKALDVNFKDIFFTVSVDKSYTNRKEKVS